jgi:hypothetical protein
MSAESSDECPEIQKALGACVFWLSSKILLESGILEIIID